MYVAGGVGPRRAVARTALPDVAYAPCGYGLVLEGANVYCALLAPVAVKVNRAVCPGCVRAVIAGIDKGRSLHGLPCPEGVQGVEYVVVGVETGLERRRTEVGAAILVVLGGKVDVDICRFSLSVGLGVCAVVETGARLVGRGKEGVAPYNGVVNVSLSAVGTRAGVARDG